MTQHTLKIHPTYFQAIVDGDKTDELRQEDDRTFAAGDRLVLREWDIMRLSEQERYDYEIARTDSEAAEEDWFLRLVEKGYTGRACTVAVTYVLRDYEGRWLQPDVAALSIRRVEKGEADAL